MASSLLIFEGSTVLDSFGSANAKFSSVTQKPKATNLKLLHMNNYLPEETHLQDNSENN